MAYSPEVIGKIGAADSPVKEWKISRIPHSGKGLLPMRLARRECFHRMTIASKAVTAA